MLIFSFISLVAGYFLKPLAAYFVAPYVFALIGAFGVPAYVFFFHSPIYESEFSFFVAFIASPVVQGLLIGPGLAHLKIESEPFIVLIPLTCSLSTIYFFNSESRRINLLYYISLSLLVHYLVGIIMGSLYSRPYQILTGLYTFSMWCLIQLDSYSMKRGKENKKDTVFLADCFHFYFVIASQCIVYGIYGVPIGYQLTD